MPNRAFRPYAVAKQAARDADPLRKLYKTRDWKYVRLRVLARDPFCRLHNPQLPPAASTIVDHKIPAKDYVAHHGGDYRYFYDEDNLQGVCASCHQKKTVTE